MSSSVGAGSVGSPSDGDGMTPAVAAANAVYAASAQGLEPPEALDATAPTAAEPITPEPHATLTDPPGKDETASAQASASPEAPEAARHKPPPIHSFEGPSTPAAWKPLESDNAAFRQAQNQCWRQLQACLVH